MSDAIDDAGLALLRRIVADVEAGRAMITRLAIHDDADGQRADIAWAPPQTSTATPAPLSDAFTDTRQATTTGAPTCPKCRRPAEEIPEDNGGGWYCQSCDLSG